MRTVKIFVLFLMLANGLAGPAAAGQDLNEQKAQVHAANEESLQHLENDRIEEALRSAKRAYELSLSVYGPEDPTTAVLQLNYGRLLIAVGSHRNALPILESALTIHETLYGTDAVELVPVLVSLGDVQQPGKQLDTVKRALALHKKHRPDDVQAYAKIAKTTGSYLATVRHHNQDSIPILEEALAIYENEYGADSVKLVPLLMSLGDARARTRKSHRQRSYYGRALDLVKKTGDEIKYAELLHTAGVHIMQLSASRDAKKYLLKAHKIFTKELGADHGMTANSRLSLARFDIATQRHQRAESNLLSALEIFKKDDNYRNHELLTLSLLVEVYEMLGKRDEATPYCQAIGQVSPWTDDQEMRPIFKRPPEYPRGAIEGRIEGHVTLEYTVDEYGLVRSPQVVDATGSKAFVPAALTSAETFRYAPRFKDGKPVKTPNVKNKFSFKLSN